MTISPEELLAQLRDDVALLALPAADQERWLAEESFPVDELALQLDDAVTTFITRLRSESLVDAVVAERLDALSKALAEISGPANARLWTEQALYDAPEWRAIRIVAESALIEIDRFGPDPARPV